MLFLLFLQSSFFFLIIEIRVDTWFQYKVWKVAFHVDKNDSLEVFEE